MAFFFNLNNYCFVFSYIHGPIIGTAYAILWTKAILIVIVLGE